MESSSCTCRRSTGPGPGAQGLGPGLGPRGAQGAGPGLGPRRAQDTGPGPGARGERMVFCLVWNVFFWPRSLEWCFYGLESSRQWNGVFSVWNGVFLGLDHPPFPYRPPSVPSFPSLTKPSLIRGAELGGKAMVGTSANKSGTDCFSDSNAPIK